MKNVELRGKRAQLINEATSIVESANKEGRSLTAEERQKFDAMEKDANAIREQIEVLERAADLKKELASVEGEKREAAAPKATSASAFEKYLRHGVGALNTEERQLLKRGQTVGTDSAGGYLVPQGFANDIDVAMEFTGEVERLAKKLNTAAGNLIDYPVIDDTSNDAAITSEASAISATDMTFSNKQLSAYNHTSLVKVSMQLLQDNAFDLNAFLIEALGERIARSTNAKFTNGTGSGQSEGVMTGASLGVTAGSASAIAAGDILNLIHSMDISYRRNAKFMANDNVISLIRQLGIGSSNDFPIFIPSLSAGENDKLFGYDIVYNNDMEGTVATGNKTLLFANFDKYVVRNAGGVQLMRLNERFADSMEVGFLVSKRVDAKVLNSAAVKYLQQA